MAVGVSTKLSPIFFLSGLGQCTDWTLGFPCSSAALLDVSCELREGLGPRQTRRGAVRPCLEQYTGRLYRLQPTQSPLPATASQLKGASHQLNIPAQLDITLSITFLHFRLIVEIHHTPYTM